jgi:KaiC/GvpD/RAD55 family RecA-like ATPase
MASASAARFLASDDVFAGLADVCVRTSTPTHTTKPKPTTWSSIRNARATVVPRIPLIEDLTDGPVPPGSNLLVEFDPASQWYNASVTISAGWLGTGGGVSYSAWAQSPESIRARLRGLGLQTEALEAKDTLKIWDGYTLTLGQKSSEKHHFESVMVADLSIGFLDRTRRDVDRIRVVDDWSAYARFNEDKSWVEFMLTRAIPSGPLWQSTAIVGLMNGVHSEWVYRRLEGACDALIDFKLEEEGKSARDLIRIRSMRNVHFDREWHQLESIHFPK